MATIRKVLITAFGDESNVTLVDETLPPPAAGAVQVRVEYAGFSGSDINMRRGTYPFQRKAPLTPGYCLVGWVGANGPGCDRFRPGDRVSCLSIYDAEAERVNLPERYLVPVPAAIDSATATALVLDWNTAYGLLTRAARVRAGQRVFIHGLSGAVGQAFLTLAKLRGADVYGTASPRNHPALIELGATPFSYADKGWIDAMRRLGGVDAVFDAVGFESYDESYSILRRGGVLVAYGLNLPALTGQTRGPVLPVVIKLFARNLAVWSGRRTTFAYIDRRSKHFVPHLTALFDLAAAGEITVPIKAVYPLERIRDAHREWGKGAGMGSLLIRVAGEGASVDPGGL